MTKENWEKEFDKEFSSLVISAENGKWEIDASQSFETIKSFIRNLLQQERTRLLDEIKRLRPDWDINGLEAEINQNKILKP